jgi:hypothetical protein
MKPRIIGFSRMSHGCTDLWGGGEEFFELGIEV